MKDFHHKLKDKLKDSLSGELPGMRSHVKMVPAIRQKEIEQRRWDKNAQRAAVLICLYPGEDGKIFVPLIRRNEYDGVHSGQISLPGGKYEYEDKNLVNTALREAEEEINIIGNSVEVLGEITPVYIPPSNFVVQPVLAWSDQKPDFKPDASEVTEIIRVSLQDLISENVRKVKDIPHREYDIINVPCFYINGNIIWGATAMILSEVTDLLQNG
jgi:8-oxo-dGTP pyrophosphatase MutT (NUDIX family)